MAAPRTVVARRHLPGASLLGWFRRRQSRPTRRHCSDCRRGRVRTRGRGRRRSLALARRVGGPNHRRPCGLRRWGIDSREVCEQGPTTWVSITAYGRRFPDRVGFGDDVAMASGQAARDVDDDWPLPTGDAIADPLTGMHAAVHALASY